MSAELPLIWINPGPNDAFQCWSTSADGDHLGPAIFIDVEYRPTEHPEEPYRFEARVADFFITKGGRRTLAEAQQIVAGAIIAHLEGLLAQIRSLVPSGYPPAEPPEASSPNPDVQMVDVVSANYHLKALNQLEASERGDAPFSVGENRALWIAICELMQARQP